MTTVLYSHAACEDHDPGKHHPESPLRLRAINSALSDITFAALERRDAPLADPSVIELAHPAAHVDRMLGAIPATGRAELDGDTIVSPGSREAALRAVGAVCAAVDAVTKGEARNAFCAVRPPGHHAERDRAMGFCLFNNIAVGAFHTQSAHGIGRVAVIDFDVHHGNGTQSMFEADGSLFYASTHQAPLYPGTGAEHERGVGNIVNAPLPPLAAGPAFRKAMEDRVLPALESFGPDLVMISAGFDGHADDPLAMLMLVEADYAWATRQLMDVAEQHAGGRVISVLEGGYHLPALGASAAAHVEALMTG